MTDNELRHVIIENYYKRIGFANPNFTSPVGFYLITEKL